MNTNKVSFHRWLMSLLPMLLLLFSFSAKSQFWFTSGGYSASEGDAGTSTVTITVLLNTPVVGNDLVLDYSITGGTATSGVDYVNTSGSLTFVAGDNSESFDITVNGDMSVEGNETITVQISNGTHSNAQGYFAGANSTTNVAINDDDAATFSIDDVTVAEGNSGTTFYTFTITHSGDDIAYPVQIFAQSANNTTSGSDVILGNDVRNFSGTSGQQVTYTVTINGDNTVELDETFFVNISENAGSFGSGNITLTDAQGLGTISNDDQSTVSISADAGAAEGTNVAFTVSMNNPSDADVVVTFTTANGTATLANSDYTQLTGANTVTIPAGQLSATTGASVATTSDLIVEVDESFSVNIAASNFNGRNIILGTTSRTGTIINNDGAEVSVSTGMATTNENDGITFTISMSNPSDADVQVTFNTSNGTATLADSDYTQVSGQTATITAGNTSTTVNVATANDNKVESNETFTGTISGLVNNSRAVSFSTSTTGTATITNDDAAEITIAGATINENDGTLAFTFAMSNPSDVATSVRFDTSNGTATAGSDFTGITNQTVTFPAGNNANRTVNVTVTGDNVVELTETFTGTMSNLVTNSRPTVTLNATTSATGTITNDDASVVSIAADANADESNPVQFTVSMTNPSDADVVVSFATSDGTALLTDFDYTQLSGTNLVTIPAGMTSATTNAAVATGNDTKYEANETFGVTIAESQFNGRAVTVHGTNNARIGTINNNDPAPTVTLSSSASIDEAAGVYNVVATLSNPSGVDVVVTLGISNQTSEGDGVDFNLASNTITILAGDLSASTTVTAIDDNIDDDNEAFRIDITTVQDGTEVGTQFAVITINDNDVPPTVTISPASVAENGGPMLMNVSLSHPSGADVILSFSATSGTAIVGTDVNGTIPDVTFTEVEMSLVGGSVLNKNISITITDDAIDEASETFTVGVSSYIGTLLSVGSTGLGTINDNDSPPTVTVADASGSEGGNVTFTVTLSNASYQDVILDFSTTGGTAISGTDFTAIPSPASHTFTASSMASGTLTRQVTVSIVDDNIDEETNAPEEFNFVVAANAGNVAALGTISGATGIIYDNDLSPTVTVTAGAAAAEGTSQSFTIALSHPSDQAIVLNYSTDADGSALGTDFTSTSGTLTFPALSTTPNEGAITVAHTSDNIDEGADNAGAGETYSFDVSYNSGGAIGAVTNAIGTIIDNDVAPAITFSNSSASEGNVVAFTFSITNGQVSAQDIVLNVSTALDGGASAAEGSDFIAVGGTVTFPALSSANQTVNVSALTDNIDEVGTSASETFTLNASQASGYTLTSLTSSAVGTITDATASPTLLVSDPTVVELNDGQSNFATFTVEITGTVSSDPIVLDVSTQAGSATADVDYVSTPSATQVTIPALGTSAPSVTVEVIGDDLHEPLGNETFTLVVTQNGSSVGQVIDTDNGSAQIQDNEPAPIATINSPAGVNEGTNVVFTVSIDKPSTQDVTVTVSTVNGSAVSGGTTLGGTNDFTPIAGQVVTFTVAEMNLGTLSKQVTVNTLDDNVYEGAIGTTEQFTLEVVGTTIATGTGNSGMGTITNNDPAPLVLLAISDNLVNEDTETATVQAILIGTTTLVPVVATVSVTNNIAIPGTDYNIDLGNGGFNLTVTPGNTISNLATFDPSSDNIYENEFDEYVVFAITAVQDGTESGVQSEIMRIQDADAAPVVNISSETELEGDALVFTVELGNAGNDIVSANNIVLNVTTSQAGVGSGFAIQGTDYTANTQQVTIPAGSDNVTFTVNSSVDALYEDFDEIFTVSGSLVGPATRITAPINSGTGTIEDANDPPVVVLSSNVTSIAEAAGVVTFTATLTGSTTSDFPVVVDFGFSGTATNVTDYTVSAGQITIPAGSSSGTFTITAVQDNIFENPDEEIVVDITNVTGGTEDGIQQLTIGIIDDEDAPEISITLSTTSVTEGGNLTITASIDNGVVNAQDMLIDFGHQAGAGNNTYYYLANDLVNSPASITILANTSSANGSIDTNDDIYDEYDEAVEIYIDGISNGGQGGANVSRSFTILDNDNAPNVGISFVDGYIDEYVSNDALEAGLDLESEKDVTINLAYYDSSNSGESADPEDYSAASQIIIFAGDLFSTITISADVDNIFEPEGPESLLVEVSSVVNAVDISSPQSLDVYESGTAPIVSISDAADVTEGGNLVYTVSLVDDGGGNLISEDVEVTFVVGAGSSSNLIAGSDYSTDVTTQTVTIPAGSTSGLLTITTTNDMLWEDTETLEVDIDFASSANYFSYPFDINNGLGNILDNDVAPSISLAANTTINEDDPNYTVTVTLSAAAGKNIDLGWSLTGTAQGGSVDYLAGMQPTVISVSGGVTPTTATFQIDPINDGLDENDETIVVSASSMTATGSPSQTITLTDAANNLPPNITISVAPGTQEEESVSHVVTATLDAPSGKDITISFAVNGGSATEVDDYVLPSDITILAGDLSGDTDFDVVDDALWEGGFGTFENALIGVSVNPANGTLNVGSDEFEIEIEDNEITPAIRMQISNNSISENGGTSTITFTMVNPADGGELWTSIVDVTVPMVLSGDATLDDDYTLTGTGWDNTNEEVFFPAGTSTRTITLTALNDNLFEGGNESAFFNVGTPMNADIFNTSQNGNVSITETNANPVLTIADASAYEEDGVVTFTITSTPPSDEDVSIDIILTDGTAVSGASATPGTPDYDATSFTVVLPAGDATVDFDITLDNDDVFETDETFTVAMDDAYGTSYDTELTFSDTATGTVLNDDTNDDPRPTVTLSGTATINEDGSGTTITASLSAMSTEDVTVDLTVTGGSSAGNALNFDNSNDFVAVAGLNGLAFSAVTIESWVYWTGSGTDIDFISGRAVEQLEIHTGGAVNQGLRFIPRAGVYLDTDPGVLPSNEWVHIACVYDPANSFAAIYINGVSVNFTNAGGSPLNTTLANGAGDLIIGLRGDGTYPFNGSLDEFRVWSVARSQAEIQQTMFGAPCPTGLELYYRFNQGVANGANGGISTATDNSSYARSGTLYNFSLSGATSNWVSGSLQDYILSAYQITIPAGMTSGSVTFTSVEDNIDEGASENFVVDISSVNNGTESGSQSVTITISDDDDAPIVTIDDASVLEDAIAGVVTFDINLSNPSNQDITINVSTSTTGVGSGHAIDGTDFTGLVNQAVFIPAGATCATVNVAVSTDNIDEVNETFSLQISSTTGGPVDADLSDTGLGTIQDDDATPTVSFDLAAYSATEDDGVSTPGSITFAFSLSHPSSEDINIYVGTQAGSAQSDIDFTSVVGPSTALNMSSINGTTVVIPALQTTGSLVVNFLTDNIDEFDETFTAQIFYGDGGVGGNGVGPGLLTSTGTITDNDNAPVLTFDAGVVSATETSGSLSFPFTLSNPSSGDITIDFSAVGSTDGSTDPAEAGDFNGMIASVVVPAGATTGTAVISIVNDNIDEFDEDLTISVSGSSVDANGPNNLGGSDSKVGTILDDDTPPAVLMSVLDNNLEEGDATDFVFTLLGNTTEKDITVELGFNDGISPAMGIADLTADYTVSTATVSLPAGDVQTTVTFTSIDESPSLDEADETVFAEILTVTNGTESGGVQNQTITIVDTDFPSVVSISTPVSVLEGSNAVGNQATITASLNLVSAKDISIDVQVAGSSVAVDGVDFGIDVVTINIPAGSSSATTTFTTVGDNYDELNENAVIEILSGVNSGNDIYTSDVNITAGTVSTTTSILDDDNAPTASLSVDITSTNESSAATITYTVTLTGTAGSSARSNLDVGVNISTGGTATQAMNAVPFGNPIDYTDPITSLGFTAAEMAGGTLSKTFIVTVNNDDVYEVATETIEMNIASAPIQMAGINNVTIGTAMVSTDIINEDPLPNVTWSQDFSTIVEMGGVSTITINQDRYSQLDTEITLSVDASSTATDLANSSIVSPQDYSIAGLTITIPSGAQTGTNTLVITGVDDLIDEDLFETVVVNVDNVTNGTLTSASQFTTNIEDNEEGPFVSLTIDVLEMDEEDGVAVITATLAEPSGLPVTINFQQVFLPGYAEVDVDYSIAGVGAADDFITVAPGDLTGTITINALQDFNTAELDETATVEIASVMNGRIGTPDQVAVVIIEDKFAPEGFVVSFNTTPIDPVNEGAVEFQIANGELPNAYGSATFTYSISDGVNTPVTGNGTITTDPQIITGIDLSHFVAGTVTVTVTLTDIYGNSSDPLIPGTSTPIATAPKSDGPDVSLSVTPTIINEEGGMATVTATLNQPIALPVTVNLSVGTGGGLATEDADFTLGASGTGDNVIVIPANQLSASITLTSIQDFSTEGDEVAQVNIASLVNGTLSTPSQVSVTLLEDRIAPQDFVVSFVTAPIDPVNQGAVSFRIANGEVGASFGYTITDGTNTITVTNAGTIANNPQVISGINLSSFLAGTVTVTVRLTDIYGNISDPANPVGSTVPVATTTRSYGPNVTLSIDRIQMFEDGGAAVVTATLAQTIALPVTVNIVDALGSAGLNSDFTLSNGGVITIQANQLTGTVNLVGISDDVFEGDETAVVRIGSAVNATVSTPNQVQVLLIEDNIPPSGFTVAFYDEVVNVLNQTRIAFDIFGGEVDATYDFVISDGTNDVIGSGLITTATSQRISNIDLSGLNEGTLTLTVTLTDPVGNVSDPQTDVIRKVPAAQVFPQGFSPNGDGVNDYWILPGIEAYPDNGVTIFNRYGTVVWDAKGYDNISVVFDGASNANGVNSSAGLPDGTYFYVVTFGSPKQVQKGFIVIRR